MALSEQQKHNMAGVIAAHSKRIVALTSKGEVLTCSGRFCTWEHRVSEGEKNSSTFIHAQHVTETIDKVVFQ